MGMTDRVYDSLMAQSDLSDDGGRGGKGATREGKKRLESGLGRFAAVELLAMALILGIVALVAFHGLLGTRGEGGRIASAVWAGLRGSNSLLYVK